MAFVKYVADPPVRPDVKISATTIVLGEKAWIDAGLRGTEWVNLFWDAPNLRVGLASTTPDDPNKFSAKKTSRGISIPARRFFQKFGIVDPSAEGGLKEVGEVIAFKVKLTISSAAPSAPVTQATSEPPATRGRRKKSDQAS